jgi:hypothetical protein
MNQRDGAGTAVRFRTLDAPGRRARRGSGGDDATVDEGWVIIELVDEEGRPRGVLDVDLSDLELVQRHVA